MIRVIRSAAAVVAFTAVGFTMAGIAAAGDVDYPPEKCTDQVGGVETVVPCTPAEVKGTVVENAAVAPVAEPAGNLPYTGSDSSRPLAEAGVVLLAAGGGAVLVAKRRRTTPI